MSKLKLKIDSLSILEIHEAGKCLWYYSLVDRDVMSTQGKLDWELGVSKLEKKILSAHPGWQYANIRENHTFMIQHYYHCTTGTRRLTKEEYIQVTGIKIDNRHYNLYLIPGAKMRERGEHKPITIPGVEKDEVSKFWNNELSKIQLYRGKSLCYEYTNGLFKKIGNGNGH